MKGLRIRKGNMEYVYFIGAMVVWFILMRWVLPKMGIGT
jgi:hypothetical protein